LNDFLSEDAKNYYEDFMGVTYLVEYKQKYDCHKYRVYRYSLEEFPAKIIKQKEIKLYFFCEDISS
jgi:hypothetical protein